MRTIAFRIDRIINAHLQAIFAARLFLGLTLTIAAVPDRQIAAEFEVFSDTIV